MSNSPYSHPLVSSDPSSLGHEYCDHEVPNISGPIRNQYHPATRPIDPNVGSAQVIQDQDQKTVHSIGLPEEKNFLDLKESLVVLTSLVCLASAVLVIAPGSPIPPRLGYSTQLQVLGVLLAIMNKCFTSISPKFFFVNECRWGRSTLQNYDAILRNSIFVSYTSISWRLTILICTFFPILLGYAYKDKIFTGDASTISISNPASKTPHFFGLAGPPGLENNWATGVSYMVNATGPWYSATRDKTGAIDPPTFPAAFGFNMLMLSETSSAMLDIPMPEYIELLRRRLQRFTTVPSLEISATVHATVSSYNDTIETLRNETTFWDPFRNLQNNTLVTDQKYGLGQRLRIDLLANDNASNNASYCFLDWHPMGPGDTQSRFRANALYFNTRREICHGTWILTIDTLQLIKGSCNQSLDQSLDVVDQSIFKAGYEFTDHYLPILTEYLLRWGTPWNSTLDIWLPPKPQWDPWLIPSYTTVVASMYWSRMTAKIGYYTWPSKDPSMPDFRDNHVLVNHSEIYYTPTDEIFILHVPVISQRSWLLYFILAFQPGLCVIIFLIGFIQYDSPLDNNFGMISILAGVWTSSLPLLKGASISGRLKKPLPLTIHTQGVLPIVVEHNGKSRPIYQVEYELGGPGGHERNERIQHHWFKRTIRELHKIKDFLVEKKVWGFSSKGSSRSATIPMGMRRLTRTDTVYERL